MFIKNSCSIVLHRNGHSHFKCSAQPVSRTDCYKTWLIDLHYSWWKIAWKKTSKNSTLLRLSKRYRFWNLVTFVEDDKQGVLAGGWMFDEWNAAGSLDCKTSSSETMNLLCKQSGERSQLIRMVLRIVKRITINFK